MGLPKIEQGYYTHPSTGSQQHREFLLTKERIFKYDFIENVDFIRVTKSGEGMNTGFQAIDYFISIEMGILKI